MHVKFLAVVLGVGLTAGLAAAEPIKVELSRFEFKIPQNVSSELFGHNEGEGKLFFYTNGVAEAAVKVPEDGEYEIVVKASGDAALGERAKFKLLADGQTVGKETVLTDDGEKEYKFTAKLKAGERKIGVEFTNDKYKEGEYDRNFYLHGLTLKKVK
jgi:hypothetical protein